MEARVIKSTGKWYVIELENGDLAPARLRGRLKLEGLSVTNPIAAGDKVLVHEEFDEERNFVIESIVPRQNYLVRKSTNLSKQKQILAANIDQFFFVSTLISPKTQPLFMDRFLVAAESFRIPATILFNKSDLFGSKEWAQFETYKAIYEPLGYPCFPIVASESQSVKDVFKGLDGQQIMLGGNSGVGKSTLVNTLDPSLNLRTGEISKVHAQGKHTTTFAEMHKMANGCYLIDTPGIRSFGLIDVAKEHVGHYFPEMRAVMADCKFHNCLHINEPACAVKNAVSNELISMQRYENYLSMLSEDDSPYRHAAHP